MGKDRDPGDQQQHPPTAQPSAVSPAPSSHPRDPKMQAARVRLPDGVYKEFEVNRSSEGDALFQQVTRDLSIEEREYFSLCFYEDGTRHWLYNDKKILRQLKGLPWEFSFEVKFYPTTPTTLVDDHARYYLFLQLRRDILTERLPATADTHALLGSFVAQIEFGDSPSQIGDDYEKFIVESKLVPASQANPEMYKKIAELHRELRAQTTSEAEILFLDHCKHLALYGIHSFKAVDKDKKEVDIGVGAAGINIYQNDQKVHTLIWQNIIKIGYKRSYFSVKVKAGTLAKDEKTLHYKLSSHLASKRAWKCAVEHHTFFRLIQPEDKPVKSFFNFGSQRFRYQGRTQFQTKMASQMFDRPSNVDRAPSSMSQPITSTEEQKLNTLNLTDSELEQRTFERYRRALTPKSYTRDDDAISSATFAKYSRPNTLLVSTSSAASPQDHDLSYSPRGLDDSNLSSAAYYMSERSSLRTPSSAYYPPSEYAASSASAMQSPTGESSSSHYYEGQYRGEYHVQMRQQTASSSGGARRNLFGRASGTSRDSVRLVSFHEPVNPDQPIPNTYPVNELPQIPIERIVHVYHEGHYDRLSPRREQRPELPYGFGNYTPRNGVSHVDRLEPHGEMDQQPIRFFVDVRHSGSSRRDPAKRISHPGKEDVKDKIDPKDYEFAAASSSDPLHRTELIRDVQPANIQQYTRRYHHGDSQKLNEPSTSAPRYRLITHVQPLVVTHHQRDGRNGQQSSSNVNATISQREQVVSTKVRRESPDADRRVRLSASVDRSGNLTDTTEDMAKSTASTSEVTTTTTIIEKKVKKQKIPPTSSVSSKKTKVVDQQIQKAEEPTTSSHESRSRFGGFFKKSSKSSKDSDSPKQAQIDKTAAPVKPTYHLVARYRHEGDEDVVEKRDTYGFASDVHEGPVDVISRSNDIEESALEHHSARYHHGESWKSAASVTSEKKTKSPKKEVEKIKSAKSPKKEKVKEPAELETKQIRLIAYVKSGTEAEPVNEEEPAVMQKKPKKEASKLPTFGFFSRSTKTTKTTGYPETSEHFTGDLDTTDRHQDLESSPFEHGEAPVYTPKKSDPYQPHPSQKEQKTYRLIARSRHEGDEDEVDSTKLRPEAYGFASTSYDGPLETTSLERDLEHSILESHSSVYHHGESWRIEKKPVSPVASAAKKGKKMESKTEKVAESSEPEVRVKLIKRVPSHEDPSGDRYVVASSKSSKAKFGFFKKSDRTASSYPDATEKFTGPTDATSRAQELANIPFEQGETTTQSIRIISETDPAVRHEKKRYFLISRFRHDGDEDVVEKPEFYAFSPESYDGPLEQTSRDGELVHAPLADHATVYHHGDSSRKEEPKPVVATLEKKVKSPKKEKIVEPAEPETRKVRLIARVKTASEVEPAKETTVTEEKPKKEGSKLPTFGFFSRSTKTTKTSGYPETSEHFTGDLDTTNRSQDLESSPFEHGDIPAYSPKKLVVDEAPEAPEAPVVQQEKRRYRLIARFRHDGDEDVVEKPDAYALASTVYDGPLEQTSRDGELDHAPLADHATVYHHGDSSRKEEPKPVVATLEKKVKSPKKEKIVEPAEPETRKVRLIARVKTASEVEPAKETTVTEEKPKKEGSKLPTFGFFSRSTKTTKTSGYPETSEHFTGDLDTTNRSQDLESSPFEHGDIPAYSPKKLVVDEAPEAPVVQQEKRRYRLIARFRHDGDEDVVEKPDAYALASTVYDGPLEQTSRDGELDHAPLADHATVYHHGDSSRKEEPKPVVATLEKKVKSPKKEKIVEPAEPETRKVRLIARVKTASEVEPAKETTVTEEKPKKEGSKLPTFGFFSRSTKTTKTSGYPETSEHFTGDLDTTNRSQDLESSPFEHGDIPAYSPKKLVVDEAPEAPVVQQEKRRYRLIARFRHDGDEDVVEKPDAYALASTVYDGPLEQTSRDGELDHAPLADHATVYHHGDSSRKEEPKPVVATLEKKVKSPKKEKIVEPAEPETRKVRLIARVKTASEVEPAKETTVTEEKPKKEGSKLPTFGFFSRSTKTTKTSGYPETSEHFTGDLDTTNRSQDLESSPFEHGDIPAYSPKKLVVDEAPEAPVVQQEKRRYRLIARFRHDGDEDVVEKPDAYALASTVYDGPLEQTSRDGELDHAPLADHATVYHHGDSSRKEEPKPVVATLEKKVKSPKKEKIVEPAEPETRKVRLIARVKTASEVEPAKETTVTEEKPKKEGSKLPTFGFFSRSTKTTKTSGYPETSEHFTGDLDTTNRSQDLESSPFEHGDIPAYSPKKLVVDEAPEAPVVQQEKRRYRLIARFRHDGDEDVVEKPDAYALASTVYDGPLEQTSRDGELDHAPLADHATVYHHGDSSRKEEPKPVVATLEKKVKSPKKEKIVEPAEPETRKVRLIARVKTASEVEPAKETTVTEEKPKKEGSKLPTFGFFSRSTKTTKTSGYPETSEHFTGDLDTINRSQDLESSPFEHGDIPAYSPKKLVVDEAPEAPEAPVVQQEKRRYRLIARFRHDGDEDVVEKPDAYALASTVYDGPLEQTSRDGELDHAPLADHATVYHHGDSSRKEEPKPVVATLEKKVKSPKKEKIVEPAEPETRKVRLIARVKTASEVEPAKETTVTEEKPKKEGSKLPTFGFFSRSTKTTKTSGYPETSEHFTGDLDTTNRSQDLESSPFEHGDIPAYSPKKLVVDEAPEAPVVQQEKRRYRLIARFRHDGDEDVVEKPDAYALASTVYDGPLEQTSRDGELDHAPLADHATVYHHGDSSRKEEPKPVVATLEKKVKSPKKEKIVEPAEPETRKVRLIARVKTASEVEPAKETTVTEEKPKKEGSKLPTFGFFSRSTKTTKTSGYPETSEHFTGDLDTTNRSQDLESSPFEHGDIPAYSPKKLVVDEAPEAPVVQQEKRRYRLIARFRHDGDEDVVEKPDAYALASTVYDGPLEQTSRDGELDHAPLADHATVYHHGDSSRKEEPKPVVATLEKKVKSPKKEKIVEPAEPETRKVRLIARVKTASEVEPAKETTVTEEKPKKEGSKLPTFGFFSRSTKTTKTSGYPETSEHFTGDLDTINRSQDLESSPFEHGDIPAYSPKKLVVDEAPEAPEAPVVQQEKRRYRLIARFRHDGDEDVVEKPDAYALASTVYDGPLEQTSRDGELDHAPLADHATVYHHGDSSRKEEPKPVVATLEKKVKSPKKEKIVEPAEPETRKVRLIARVKTASEVEPAKETTVTEEKPKKEGSKLPTIGFFSRSTKTTKTSGYPETSEHFTGDLDTTNRSQDLESSPFEHGDIPAYSPKKLVVDEAPEAPEAPVVQQEKRRYRLIARFRHDGDEDVVEKPDAYALASTVYDGPLEQTSRDGELDHAPLADHATVYHHGDSSRKEEPKPVVATLEKKVKSPKKEKIVEPAEPETRKVRLIARVKTASEVEPAKETTVTEEKPKKEGSKLPTFGFFSRSTKTTKTSGYPETSEHFTGDLDTTNRSQDLESSPFEHGDIPAYSPKKLVVDEAPEAPVVQQEKRRYRLIARFRHDGDEDVVEKPDAYALASTVYDGPLEQTSRDGELDHAPLADHATVYHHGDSSRKEEPKPVVATLEKKVKSPKKEKIMEPAEPETRKVRLIARVKTASEVEPAKETTVTEEKPKKEGSKLPTFGFFSRSTKTTKTSGYPETSEHFTGDLDTTNRSQDLESSPFEHGDIPAYSPKKLVVDEAPEAPVVQQEKRRYRLIARFRHDGDEDVVEKPDAYALASTVYDGPLEQTSRDGELDHAPLADHATVYHHGDSSRKEEPKPVVATLEKKVKSPKKEKIVEPAEPETRKVRLIARVKTASEVEPAKETTVTEEKPKKEGSKLPTFGFFSRSTKTTKTSGYPETSEHFTGDLDTINRSQDLESSPFEHGDIPAYSPKKLVVDEAPEAPEAPVVQQEKRRYRLIARFRHDGDEDVVEKPDAYALASTVYDGPLEQTSRDGELDHAPLADHATVYHHGDSSRKEEPKPVVATLEKKQKKAKSPKKEETVAKNEAVVPLVRLIARVKSKPEAEENIAGTSNKEQKSKKEGTKFGLFTRSKSSKSEIPVESAYSGPLETTTRTDELENRPFEQDAVPVPLPGTNVEIVDDVVEQIVHDEKKRFRWFGRFRHEGDEDEVEKPEVYALSKDVYDGPLDKIACNSEVEQLPIADYSAVYHHGESWRKEKPISRPATLEKKQKTTKPLKEVTPEPEESPDVRLVARVKPMVSETESIPDEKASPTKHRSRASSFAIFHRQSKTTGYPETSPVYEGHLDVTGRAQDVTQLPLEHRDYPEYSPKKADSVEPVVHQRESRIYRLIARFRHEGEEDVVEKPGAYSFASTVYDGPLDETAKHSEIEESPIGDFSAVYHHGESWRKDVMATTPVSTAEKKQKSKKEKIVKPSEEEKHDVKLVASVRSEELDENKPESDQEEERSPQKDDTSKPFRLRLFSSASKQKSHSAYPETSPTYDGPLDVTGRSDELEKMPYLHGEVPRYSPGLPPKVMTKSKENKLLYSHELKSPVYDGPLESVIRQDDLEQTPLGDHATVYHQGESWRKDESVLDSEKKSKNKKIIRLVAKVPPHELDPSTSETSVEKSPRKDDKEMKPFRFRFFSLSNKGSKNHGYPEMQPMYEGPLDVTGHSQQVEQVPIEIREFPAYSPKKTEKESETVVAAAPEVEKKLYRLIARFRHEGDEDEVEKPEAYQFSSVIYDGPLEYIQRQEELDQAPIGDHSTVYHHGESWRKETTVNPKKVRLSTEVEQHQLPEMQEDIENVPPKASRFSFLRGVKPNRSSRATSYPSTSENYSGPLDITDRNSDLEKIPLDQSVTRPKYSSRKPTELSTEADRKYRLMTRIRHEGLEDEVDQSNVQPVFYAFPPGAFAGKYEPSPFVTEVEEYPLEDFTAVYHHGHSGSRLRHIMGKLTKDKKPSGPYTESKADVKLIARVLPMQKTPIVPETPVTDDEKLAEPLTRSSELEPRAMTDIVGPSTSTARTSTLVIENTVNYFPSSLQYEPRAARIEGYTGDGHGYVEVRLERRAEVQLEPVYLLRETTRSHAYLSTATTYFSGASSSTVEPSTSHSLVPFVGSVSEDETGLHFSSAPLNMSPPERQSFLARLGFKRDKNKKKDKKKGKNESSNETSDSEHDEKREFAVVEFQPHDEKKKKSSQLPQEGPKKPEHRTHKSPGRRLDEPMNEVTVVVTGGETRPAELGDTKEVRHETREQQFRLTGDGYTSGFNPNDPSLMATIQRAERLNASSPRLEHAERTFTVRANAPLPVSFEESGQPYTTVSTWQETSDLPEQVEVYTDENGRQITRTIKSSQVKHTVQTQSFQNYIVDGDQVPVGVVDVERSREQLTPLGQQATSSENGGDSGIVETQTRTMTYEAQGGENAAPPGWAEQGLGEYVSSKSVTQGNRTIETITYKTEKDGVVETHVEHRVTIHSDGDIDHDAELSQAIAEATQMNPDMVVEKIEVRQETTQ